MIAVPPNSVTLKEPKVTKAGEFLELACTATDANPKSNIVWYRGSGQNLMPITAEGRNLIVRDNKDGRLLRKGVEKPVLDVIKASTVVICGHITTIIHSPCYKTFLRL